MLRPVDFLRVLRTMAQFVITISERHAVEYLVEAESSDQALELFEEGEATEVKLRDDIVETDVVEIRKTEIGYRM